MTRYEYTAIPAPLRTEKSKDSKSASDRFAASLTAELNRMAADGWEYIRADVLPSEERSGLTGKSTVYHNLLIFRKQLDVHDTRIDAQPVKQPAPITQTKPVETPTQVKDPVATENNHEEK